MRDLLVTAMVLGVIPFALRHAYVGVLLWTWIGLMNPHRLAYGFAASAPFAMLAAAVVVIGLFTTKDRIRLPVNAAVVALACLVVWMGVTTYAAFEVPDSTTQYVKVLKILLMIFVALAVIRESHQVDALVWVLVASLGFYGVKGGIFTILTGGSERVWGPPGTFIAGNNEVALALVMTIPLMNYLRTISANPWVRHGLVGAMVLSAAAALGSQSRGALLAITAMALTLWWRSRNRLYGAIAMAVVAPPLVMFMPDTWEQRMSTIQTYQQDGSAMGRIDAWWTMFNLANDRIVGGGFMSYTDEIFQTYALVPREPLAAHSIYFQMLGEHGWVGLALFLAVWLLVFAYAGRIRLAGRRAPGGIDDATAQARAAPGPARWGLLAAMCQVSLVGYAVGGAFLSLAYFDLPYNILVIIVALRGLLARQAQLARDDAGGDAPAGGRTTPTAAAPRRRSFGNAIPSESRRA